MKRILNFCLENLLRYRKDDGLLSETHETLFLVQFKEELN